MKRCPGYQRTCLTDIPEARWLCHFCYRTWQLAKKAA